MKYIISFSIVGIFFTNIYDNLEIKGLHWFITYSVECHLTRVNLCLLAWILFDPLMSHRTWPIYKGIPRGKSDALLHAPASPSARAVRVETLAPAAGHVHPPLPLRRR